MGSPALTNPATFTLMSLFKVNELTNQKETHTPASASVMGITHLAIGKVGQKIDDVIGIIAPGESKHYASMGEWSTHDLLFHFLNQTGPAEVYFTTWAISEFAIRQLYAFVSSGLITKLSGIFDYRNGIHKPAELQFLKQMKAFSSWYIISRAPLPVSPWASLIIPLILR